MSVFRVGATRLMPLHPLHPLIDVANRTLVPCAPLRAGPRRRLSSACPDESRVASRMAGVHAPKPNNEAPVTPWA